MPPPNREGGPTASATTTAGTSHTISLGSPTAGWIIVVFVRYAGAPGTVTFTGYTSLVSDSSDASDDTTQIFWKLSDGTEGADDTLTTANSIKLAAFSVRASEAANRAPAISAVAVGTTVANTCSPNNVAPTQLLEDTLYLAFGGCDGESTFTAAPTNYTNFQGATSGTGGAVATNCFIGAGVRTILGSTGDDAGTFTHGAANAGWTAFAVALSGRDTYAAPTNYGTHAVFNRRVPWWRRRSGIFVPCPI